MEDAGLLVEDDMKIPASSERTNGGFDSKTLSGDDPNLNRAVRAVRVCSGDTRGIELLVRRVDHFVLCRELVVNQEICKGPTDLLREVNPKLQADRIRLSVLVNRHFCMDD